MIRFVYIGDQITEGEKHFAFYDTVTNRFVEFYGEQVFSDFRDFDECARADGAITPEFYSLCLDLIPEDFK